MIPKRQRVKQACDHCRTKKAKCDGLTPSCSTCVLNNERCRYTESSKRRGLPPGYTRDLEKKVGILSAIIGELSVDDHNMDVKIRALMSNEEKLLNIVGESKWETSLVTSLVDEFISKYGGRVGERKSQPVKLESEQQLQTTEVIPSGRPASRPMLVPPPALTPAQQQVQQAPPGTTPFFYDPINDPSFFLNYDIFQFIAEEIEPSNTTWEPIALQYHGLSQSISGFTNRAIQKYNFSRNPFRVGSIFNVSSFVNAVKPPQEIFLFPPNLQTIVDEYFRIHHPWIPMLDRVSIIRQVQQLSKQTPTSDNKSNTTAPDLNLIALVWAVVAMGQLAISPLDIATTQTYAKHAIIALENSITSTIETIQAQVLLGIYYYQLGMWDFSWVLISSGSRMAIDVRLMRPSAPANSSGYIHNETVESLANGKKYITTLNNINRERTWASVYIINTVLAARMGRSPVVRASDWPIPSINTEGWEEWESWEGGNIKLEAGRFLSTFNEAVKVVSIVNLAITSNIDTSKGMLDVTGGVKLEESDIKSNTLSIASFKNMLNDWFNNLPDYCRLEHYTAPELVPAPMAFLHLGRDLTWCILAIRLSYLDISSNNTIIKSRDFQYTRAITSIRRIINQRTVGHLQYYPFIDYFLIMCVNFPHMIDLPPHERDKILEDFKSCLMSASTTSIPCRISLDIYKLMNADRGTISTKESPMIANLLNNSSPPLPPREIATSTTTPIDERSKALLDGINSLSPPQAAAGQHPQVQPPVLPPPTPFPTSATTLPYPSTVSMMPHIEGFRLFRNDDADNRSSIRNIPRVNGRE
ncbi:Quinic acid utilization activator [Spathaspora sp. JA1]|nr:Quinic acid utilization activator [Spathaspora sp. JA1]